MCNVHNKVFGKEAVYEMIKIELGQVKACDGRVKYLEQQIESFKLYLNSKGADFDALKEHWLKTDFQPEQYIRDEGLVDCMHQASDRDSQLRAEEDMAFLMDSILEANVRKAYAKTYGVEGNLRFWEGKLEYAEDRLAKLVKELRLCEKTQDHLDKYKDNKPTVVSTKGWLQDMFAANRIEFETYSMFINQCNELLEKIDGYNRYRVAESKAQLIPDRIKYFEQKVNELKLKVQTAHLELFKEKDESIELNVEAVAAEGFKLATNDNEFEQVLAFVRQNS